MNDNVFVRNGFQRPSHSSARSDETALQRFQAEADVLQQQLVETLVADIAHQLRLPDTDDCHTDTLS